MAVHNREVRLPAQLERQEETPEESQQMRQREFEERQSRRRGNRKACNISDIFSGNESICSNENIDSVSINLKLSYQ